MLKTPRERLTGLALIVLLITACFGLRHRMIDVDFIAFDCGGEAVRMHADPYVMQPLYGCEERRFADLGRPDLGTVVTPSPLPVYALVPFAVLSLLPTKMALIFWDITISACLVLSIVLLKAMTRINVPTIAAALFVGGIYISLALGQLVPVILASIIVTVWAVGCERDTLAAIGGGLTMFEPNVGLPVCLTLFCMRAKARMPLMLIAVLFAVVTILAAPLSQTLTYFHEILPAHASSEIRNDEQLSLTHLLALGGAPDHVALAGGSFSYIILLVVGTFLALRLGQKLAYQRIAIVLAPAMTTLGGTYLHVQQFTIVAVLALLVFSMSPKSSMAKYGLLLVALPLIAAGSVLDMVMFTCIAAIIGLEICDGSTHKAIQCCGITLLVTGIVHVIRTHYRESTAQIARMKIDVAFATQHARIPEDVWRVFINEHVFTLLGWNAVVFDIPLFVGALCTIYAAFQLKHEGV